MKRPGLTMIEVLLYMALSGLIILVMVGFLGNMMTARAVLASQTSAQEYARATMEQMTVAIRHGYRVDISGSTLTISSHPAGSSTTVYTVFERRGDDLRSGSGTDRDAIVMNSVLPDHLTATSFTLEKISSAVDVQLTLESRGRQARLQSVIAYRQNE